MCIRDRYNSLHRFRRLIRITREIKVSNFKSLLSLIKKSSCLSKNRKIFKWFSMLFYHWSCIWRLHFATMYNFSSRHHVMPIKCMSISIFFLSMKKKCLVSRTTFTISVRKRLFSLGGTFAFHTLLMRIRKTHE